jgi:hypothetical protein
VQCCHGPLTGGGRRDKITTGQPAAAKCVANETPRNPLPPAMTIGPRCEVLFMVIAGFISTSIGDEEF